MADEKEYKYAVKELDEFTVSLAGDTIKSKDKVITLNEAQHNDLNKLIKSGRPDLTRHLQLIDMAAAEKIAKEHMAQTRGNATQGAHNTSHASQAQGKDLNTLQPVQEIPVPDGAPKNPLERLKARTGTGNVAQLDTTQAPASVLTSQEKAQKVLDNAQQSEVFHPEDDKEVNKVV